MNKFEGKVAGTKYIVILLERNSQWYINLMLDRNLEGEELVTAVTKRGISTAIKNVLKKVKIVLNELQLDMLVGTIYKQAETVIAQQQPVKSKDDPEPMEPQVDLSKIESQLEQLFENIKGINHKLDEFDERIKRLENLNSTNEPVSVV
jgi:peptidoglycan hydrolase CwlO-like protein